MKPVLDDLAVALSVVGMGMSLLSVLMARRNRRRFAELLERAWLDGVRHGEGIGTDGKSSGGEQ